MRLKHLATAKDGSTEETNADSKTTLPVHSHHHKIKNNNNMILLCGLSQVNASPHYKCQNKSNTVHQKGTGSV